MAVVAVSKTSTLSLYRNGRVVATQGVLLSVPWKPESPPLYLGVNAFDVHKPRPISYWQGRLDEVAVWRRALTGEEITRLYEEAPK